MERLLLYEFCEADAKVTELFNCKFGTDNPAMTTGAFMPGSWRVCGADVCELPPCAGNCCML